MQISGLIKQISGTIEQISGTVMQISEMFVQISEKIKQISGIIKADIRSNCVHTREPCTQCSHRVLVAVDDLAVKKGNSWSIFTF